MISSLPPAGSISVGTDWQYPTLDARKSVQLIAQDWQNRRE
jgi:hypothetical protein